MFEPDASAPRSPEAAPPTRVAARRERLRAEILDAAWDLCREKGLAALSLRELASRVGMAAPSLYSYFGSKDEIYDAMFRQGQLAMGEAMAAFAEPGPHVGRPEIRSAARAFFSFCTEDPVRYQLMFQRTVPGFVPSAESYALAIERLHLVGDHLRAAGVTDPAAGDLWTAVFTGLTDQQISNDPGGDRWGRLVDDAVDMLCDHFAIPQGPSNHEEPTR